MALLSNQCLYVLIVWSGSIPGWHGAFIIENWELKIENGCVIIFICLLSLLKGGEIIQHLFIRQLVEKTHEFSLLFYFPGWHGAPAPCKNTRCSALTLHFSDAFAPCKEGSVWSGSISGWHGAPAPCKYIECTAITSHFSCWRKSPDLCLIGPAPNVIKWNNSIMQRCYFPLRLFLLFAFQAS